MACKWVKLGDYIEQCDERNTESEYGETSVKGISTNKVFINTKANLVGVSLRSYKKVSPKYFAFVPDTSRRGDKIALAYNDSNEIYLISSIYCVFKVLNTSLLSQDYLYIIFNRAEFDRYARFNSWGSAREVFSWQDLCNTKIPLPSIEEQNKIVNVCKACKEIKKQNEAKAAPLMQLCQSYIQELKHNCESLEIGNFIEECGDKNIDDKYNKSSVRGLATSKGLIETKADLSGVSLKSYKLIKPNEIAFVPDTSRRGDKMSLGMNDTNETFLVSSISCVFRISDTEKLLPEFLYLWFCRSEFDRYARFNSWGSAREAFSFEDMQRVKIPLPPIEVQQAIVNIYKCANEAKQIAEEADKLAKEVCPALIQHAIHS